ncbi:MAG: hypothetical protein QW600_00140 [Candidatus Bathyarchaeia archaeon]|nr:hypothetical protein [Candidatus Bathyarchaeota archaeon]
MLQLSNFWDFIERFKETCKAKGWKILEQGDIIYEGGKYHQMILLHQIHFETFRRVTLNPHRFIREGETLNMINISYIAWISREAIPSEALNFIFAEPRLLSRVALYDLSPLREGRKLCLKINETDSAVFREFENFLEKNGLSSLPLTKKENINFSH